MADRHEDGGARAPGGRTHGRDETGAESDSGRRGVRTMPLNSRRLTAPLLRQLAGGLGVPTTASRGDLYPMIEGKLTEAGRDPLRTQVVLREVDRGIHLSLQDETGVFSEFEPPQPEDLPPPDSSGGEGGEESEPEVPELVVELRAEVAQLKMELEVQKTRTKDTWKLSCEQLAEMDNELSEKDEEIGRLREELARLRRRSPSAGSEMSEHSVDDGGGPPTSRSRFRRGKAPPVDAFTGEDPESRLDDWLPTLKRAAHWNGWTEDDLFIQLAGHLKGRALQEWNLLSDSEKETYELATTTLRSRLDPGSKIMAAQDFRHASQEENEKVGDFMRRLEQLFKLAYGRDIISAETRGTLLYGQL